MPISIPFQGSKLNVRDRMRAEALACDNEAMLVWYNRLVEIALNGIKWHNLPPEIDPRYLEMALLFCGSAIFFYDEDAGKFAVWRFMPVGRWDHYRDPIKRRAIPEEGWSYNRILTPRDSVCIYNNLTRTPDVLALRYYVRKLWQIDRALDRVEPVLAAFLTAAHVRKPRRPVSGQYPVCFRQQVSRRGRRN